MIAEVTAALDTFRDAAICGSDGKRILVASVPVAASIARTAICRKVEETSGRGAAATAETVWSVMEAPGLYGHDTYHIKRGRERLMGCFGVFAGQGRKKEGRSSLRANGSRECAPDDRLREAIHSRKERLDCFVAALLAMTKGTNSRVNPQQARSTCGPSPTISGCRASETAGDIRITSACAPKIAAAR